jgi:disease resistance protein RPM1
LHSHRYFIVIDDVWEKESWETIRLAFIDTNTGSRIVSTTRKSEVTIGNKIYKPKPLSDEDSKRLFYKRIFGGEDKCSDKQVDEVSDEILKKCGGIPLAIITMASLLVGKSKGEWSEVCKSMGFRDKDIGQLDRTMWILSLSYYDLPCHLRTCLLYLSAFPEDHFIDKNSLIWKWIAEDFVHNKKPGTGLFEVGEGYFNELVNRSMIQAVESQNDGIIDGCRVHDMVLDLLCSLSHKENFVMISDNNEDTISTRSIRKLSHRKSKIVASMGKRRSMLKMKSFIGYWCGVDVELPFLSFKLLRVLDLEHVYSKSWHNAVYLGNLIHLRYLGFKRTDMHELPKEIGALKFLQTLDLVGNVLIKRLPSTVDKLTQLVCLRAWGTISWGTSMPNGVIRKLRSLEELVVQCNSGDEQNKYKVQFLKELGNLTALRVLTVKVIEMDQSKLSDLVQSVASLHNIQSLKLEPHCPDRACVYNATFDAGALPRHLRQLLVSGKCFSFSSFPSCIDPSCHIKLSHLELDVISMDEQSMVVLGGLPELRHLVLSTKSTVTITNIATDGCFQKLRFGKFPSSMVLIVLDEDSSVSFTLWNGTSDLVFGPTKKDECCTRAPAVMPNLEELSFKLIDLWPSREGEGSCYDNLGWEYVASLQKVTVTIDDAQMMEAEDKLRHATAVHPNHPTLVFQTPTKIVSPA